MDVARGLGRLLSASAVVAALLLVPATALADCQPIPFEKALDGSEVVFIGTVTSVDAGGLSADIEVSEVWRGDVGDRIVVDGGLDPANPAEDDRRFEVGVTYIFVPTSVDGRLVDSICSATIQWDEKAMAGFRPPEARAPEPVPVATSGPLAFFGDLVGPLVVAAIVGVLLVLTVALARRREA